MWDDLTKIYMKESDQYKMTEINNLIAYIDFIPWHTKTLFGFVKDKTELLLNRLGFTWKEPDQEVIQNLISYAKKVGFFD
jgi:hypothetical protein